MTTHNILPSARVLYLCYFGLHEPLVQTQVLPYLREIQKGGTEVSLLTFEPKFKKTWSSEKIEAETLKLADENINWFALGYHKRPSVPATAFDVLCGTWFSWRLLRREHFDIIHVRIHIPAVMAILARKFSRQKPKILFDIRGFIPEEYVDAGIWKKNGLLYKLVKRMENWILRNSDGFVILTEKAREILFPESAKTGKDKFNRPVEVIPCCVDFYRFNSVNQELRSKIRQKYNLENRRVIIYVGSFGGWYLTDEMLDFFQVAHEHDPQAFALILTQRDKEKIVEKLRERGITEADSLVESVSPDEIPTFLSASDVALSFIKACYSKQSSSPTKIAEYLAGGVPIIANSGVGDVDELIEENDVGVIVKNFGSKDYIQALNKIDELRKLGDLSKHCAETAKKVFDLETVGGKKYRRLYKKLLSN